MAEKKKSDGPPPPRGLKWVFTIDGEESERNQGDIYEAMARVAVQSALAHTSLTPVCVFNGEPNRKSHWLEKHGVRVIFHDPEWRNLLYAGYLRGKALHNSDRSPLYGDFKMMLST